LATLWAYTSPNWALIRAQNSVNRTRQGYCQARSKRRPGRDHPFRCGSTTYRRPRPGRVGHHPLRQLRRWPAQLPADYRRLELRRPPLPPPAPRSWTAPGPSPRWNRPGNPTIRPSGGPGRAVLPAGARKLPARRNTARLGRCVVFHYVGKTAGRGALFESEVRRPDQRAGPGDRTRRALRVMEGGWPRLRG
jgi:hypothetical protein